MSAEQLVANYTPVGDGISILTCLVLLIIVARVLYFSKDVKFLFLQRSLHFIVLGSAANIVFFIVAKQFSEHVTLLIVLRDLYHISFMICQYCFIYYLKEMLTVKDRFITVVTYLTRTLFVAAIVMDALSPITKFGFYYENGAWSDTMASPYNLVYLYTVLLLMIMLVAYSKRLIRSLRSCLMATEILIGIVMIYQGIRNINSLTSFTYVLPILVVMILLHSKPFDDKTGALSAKSFESYVKQKYKSGKKLDYMVLKLYFSDLEPLPDEIGKALNSFWHKLLIDAVLFNIDFNTYVLAIPQNPLNGDTRKKVLSLINDTFGKYYSIYQIPYKIIGLFGLDFIENVGDFIGITKYMMVTMEENKIVIADDKKKEELRLLKTIRENLEDINKIGDLDDPRVLVYCQPIRNLKTGKFDTAEALMRLTIRDKGIIMPYMFITLAEQYNCINSLTKIMLNKVCKQIKSLEKDGYVFERISVNFTASDIMPEKAVENILEIIRHNDVNPSLIGIELTETETESDFMIVKSRIEALRKAGMTVYLDDVGTGYSNLDRIVRYDVDVVKFDRFFLLEAEKDDKIVKMMSHLSEAFRDLNYKLLYEGVETEDNEKLCVECGADYIQGFKYSKPVPMEEMRNFFEKK